MTCLVRILVLSQCLCAHILHAISNPDAELSEWCADRESCEVQAAGVDHVLLQKAQTRDVAASHASSEIDTPRQNRLKASSVPVNEEGYKMILKLKNEREMSEFINRAASELGFEITEEAKLNGVVPYYSGKKAAQSFAALKSELDNTSKGPKGWARIPGKKARRASPFIGSGQSLLQSSQQIGGRRSKAVAHRMNTSAKPSMKAAEVLLNEQGYKTIAKMKNEREMTYFVRRVAQENGYEIVDIGSLNGVVPYYSGKKATQSFVALQDELTRTSKDPKGWAKKSKKKQEIHADLMEMQASDSGDQKVKERSREHGGKHIEKTGKVESTHKAEPKNIHPKRKVKLADIHRKNNKQHATSPKKSANKHRDDMPDVIHSDKNKQGHDSKKSQDHSKGGRKDSASASEHANHAGNNAQSNAAGKKRNEDSKNKRHATNKADNDLASTEASELDETMLTATVKGKMHAKVEPTQKDTIKKNDVSALHVVGQVKVETAVPPAKIHP